MHLSSTEFDLLATLMRRSRVVFTREQLAGILGAGDFYGELRLVDNHVYRLREKLSSAGLQNCPIVTVRGLAMRFGPRTGVRARRPGSKSVRSPRMVRAGSPRDVCTPRAKWRSERALRWRWPWLPEAG